MSTRKKWAVEDDLEAEEELEELEMEVEKAHKAISDQNYKALEKIYYNNFVGDLIFNVIEYTLKEVIKENEYSFKKSQAMYPLYVMYDRSKEVRISDYKCLAYSINKFSKEEHRYDHEIIEKSCEFRKHQLESVDINLKENNDILYHRRWTANKINIFMIGLNTTPFK
ncbi:hypothetical protein [Staphylococcus sp. 17KM0847]|uniref:hypothetical protein n=1 Tax=Staphylococcus sp. 17KM0847 TaxID=2583989 RepID=UPI0015E012AE|nr:hypothetical protein [Staphylococcus sp. 17KM0847]